MITHESEGQERQPANPKEQEGSINALVFDVQRNLQQAADLYKTDPDSPLIAAYVEQARQGFDDVVRMTHGVTRKHAYGFVKNVDDAEDVTQETYRRAWSSIHTFRGRSHFGGWLYRITANTASHYRVKKTRNQHLDIASQPETIFWVDEHPDKNLEGSQLLDWYHRAVEYLNPKLQTVLDLRLKHGLSYEAIAHKLGISENTAKLRMYRARRKLAEMRQRELTDDDSQIVG